VTDIRPRWQDGLPICDFDCPRKDACDEYGVPTGDVCPPAVRQLSRDHRELRKGREEIVRLTARLAEMQEVLDNYDPYYGIAPKGGLMTDISTAAGLLGVKETELRPFDVEDRFNDGQRIEGHICLRSDHRYGALVIHAVAGRRTEPQRIYCTPKLHYPFGRTPDEGRHYHWPRDVRRVEVYEKLDGTNVCVYGYQDADGQRFATAKTRLTAVAGASKFGDFGGMWEELRAPAMADVEAWARAGLCAVSFEMYGRRNPVLVAYDVPLQCRLLFSVSQDDGSVSVPPFHPLSLKPVEVCDNPDDLTAMFDRLRASAEAKNKRTPDGDFIEGLEGYVLYVEDAAGEWTMWKCKPESVEQLHWASDYLPESVILPTAWNALESCDDLTADVVAELLREEFTEVQVSKSWPRIEKAVAEVLAKLAFRGRVRDAYVATGLRLADGRGPVMRALSEHFERSDMRRVFTALQEVAT